MKVLIVEDEKKLAAALKKGLVELSHTVDVAHDGETGYALAEGGSFDVIILDVLLPKLNGFEVIEKLRSRQIQTPVLFLTAKGDVSDKVKGFDLGCDDYLVKPFSFSELLARLQALYRRKSSPAAVVLHHLDLSLDLSTREVRRGGRLIDLRPKEFAILQFLLENQGRVITRTQLMEHVWDYAFASGSNVIDVHMKRLREKIDGAGDRKLLQTVKGVGYRLG